MKPIKRYYFNKKKQEKYKKTQFLIIFNQNPDAKNREESNISASTFQGANNSLKEQEMLNLCRQNNQKTLKKSIIIKSGR